MTNADKIRAMTDEELASTLQDYSSICGFGRCPAYMHSCGFSVSDCADAWLAWLKQEADECPN